jgi:hypothetical protein
MKRTIIFLALVFAGMAFAGTTNLPLPAGYPALLGVSCGGVHVASYVTGFDVNGNITGEVYAWTRCGASGRGGGYHSKVYESWHSITWGIDGGWYVLAPTYDGAIPNPAWIETDAFGNTISNACNGTTNGRPACVAQVTQ